MVDTFEIITKNARETAKVGERLVGERSPLVCLYGDLGSGKTTFTQGFARGLGINTRLLSPTYIIVRRYELPKKLFFFHVDLYRVKSEHEIEGLGLLEILNDPDASIIIEWADRLGDLLPKERTDIRFSVLNDGRHKITIR